MVAIEKRPPPHKHATITRNPAPLLSIPDTASLLLACYLRIT